MLSSEQKVLDLSILIISYPLHLCYFDLSNYFYSCPIIKFPFLNLFEFTVLQAVFTWVNGAYKASDLLLRSSIENFNKAMIGKCNTDVYTKKMYTKYLIWPINWMNIKSPSEKNHCQQYCIGFIVNYVKQHTLQRHASGAFNRLRGAYATLRNFLL